METRRASNVDLVLLAIAIGAVSTSAPLVREADAPALAIAFWRNAMALPVLAVAVAVSRPRGGALFPPEARRATFAAGLFLAAHFATWIPSLSYTSVASSVALVATQPVWAALIARARGHVTPPGTWTGIGLAMAGVVALTGVDLSTSGRALFGDLLALVGGALAALYVTAGAEARQHADTTSYALVCYSIAALVLFGMGASSGQAMAGYSAHTWWVLLAITVGPQLLGHTLINRVLRTISPTVVSVAILLEIVGAAALAWMWFDERPSAGVVPAAVLLVAGVITVIRAGQRPEVAGVPAVE